MHSPGLTYFDTTLTQTPTSTTTSGYESATDCGGGCSPCSPGSRCYVGQDCSSGICANLGVGTPAACRSPSCLDRVANGLEADVDCGTACCDTTASLSSCTALCGNGFACKSGLDCASGRCFLNPALGTRFCSGTKASVAEPLLSTRLLGAVGLTGLRKQDLPASALLTALSFYLDVPVPHLSLEALADVQLSPSQWGLYGYTAIRENNTGISIDALTGEVTYPSSNGGVVSSTGGGGVLPPILPTYWITTQDTVVGVEVRYSVYVHPGDADLMMGRMARLLTDTAATSAVLEAGWTTLYGLMDAAAAAADTYAYCFSYYNASNLLDEGGEPLFSNDTLNGGVDCSPFLVDVNGSSDGGSGSATVVTGADSAAVARLRSLLPAYATFLLGNSTASSVSSLRRRRRALHGVGGGGMLPDAPRALSVDDAPTAWRLNAAASAVNYSFGLNVTALPHTAFRPVVAASLAIPSSSFSLYPLENVSYDSGMDGPSPVFFPDHVAVLQQPRGIPSHPLWGGYRFAIQPCVALVDRHRRLVMGIDPTNQLGVTVALVVEGSSATVLTGTAFVRFGPDGVARYTDLG